MGLKWPDYNEIAAEARSSAEQQREAYALLIRQAYASLIDRTVRVGVRKRLDAHKMELVNDWAEKLKIGLGLHEGETVLPALLDKATQGTADMVISAPKNAILLGDDILTADGNALSDHFQPAYIVEHIGRDANRSHSPQHSLAHFSRINGRHARILGVETGGEAKYGGYWIQQA